jgi:hypothetical protein
VSSATEHDEVSFEGWVFGDSPRAAAFTTKRILSGDDVITYVTHDSGDGAWQFYGTDEFRLDDMAAVCLHHIVEKDRTLEQLADLPRGWYAWRDDVSSPWMRALRDED